MTEPTVDKLRMQMLLEILSGQIGTPQLAPNGAYIYR